MNFMSYFSGENKERERKQKYRFGYYDHDEDKWRVAGRHFLVDPNNENIGQFVSSNWFSYYLRYDKDEIKPFHFTIMGDEYPFRKEECMDMLNTNYNSVPSCHDLQRNKFEVADYFVLDRKTIISLMETMENDESTRFTMRGYFNPNITLTISARRWLNNNGDKDDTKNLMLGLSCPEFEIHKEC